MSPAHVTVAVQNIYAGADKQDVENHFKRLLIKGRPYVGPVVPYIFRHDNTNSYERPSSSDTEDKRPDHVDILRLATTVTFEAENLRACEHAVLDKLHCSELLPRRDFNSSIISVNKEFLGITPLNEKPDHEFDFIFIHGLGGHAFQTWAYNGSKDSKVTMWPRDLLPDYLFERGLSGRFMTLGYAASPVDRGSTGVDLEKAALNLLNLLREHRHETDQRPIYFGVHSLGGLVLIKALCMELWQGNGKERSPAFVKRSPRIFMRDGKCIVKGIAFFGTPFQGSKVATTMLPIAKILGSLGRNKELIPTLQYKHKDLAILCARFNQVQDRWKIGIRLFYENLPLYARFRFMVTDQESACGTFGKEVKPVALHGNHRTMVKFSGDRDNSWERVAQELDDMVTEGQRDAKDKQQLDFKQFNITGLPTSPPSTRDGTDSGYASANGAVSGPNIHPVNTVRTNEIAPGSGLQIRRRISRTASWTKRRMGRIGRRFFYSVKPGPVPERKGNFDFNTASVTIREDVDGTKMMYDGAVLPGNVDPVLEDSLKKYDTIFIIDDSVTMKKEDIPYNKADGSFISRWRCLCQAVSSFADVAAQFDEDGVDVHFMINRNKDQEGIKEGQSVLEILRNITPSSKEKYLDNVLNPILVSHIAAFRQSQNEGSARPKPINVIVITDGVIRDYEKVENTIVRVAAALRALHAPPRQVGVQLVQIGFDPIAGNWFESWDDKLRLMYGVRDIVDTRGFEPDHNYGARLQEYIKQVLLGAIDNTIDQQRNVEEMSVPGSNGRPHPRRGMTF